MTGFPEFPLPMETRITVLEERDRQTHEWKQERVRWEEHTEKELGGLKTSVAVLHTKVALYAAIGSAVGAGVVSLIVYLILGGVSGAPTPQVHTP